MNKSSAILLSVILCFGLNSCSIISPTRTVTPTVVESQKPSYDEGKRNSGIEGPTEDAQGFYVTPHFVERYNALIGKYAYRFQVPPKENEGIKFKDGRIIIDAQRFMYFLDMNITDKSGGQLTSTNSLANTSNGSLKPLSGASSSNSGGVWDWIVSFFKKK